jgi:VanZ family protein
MPLRVTGLARVAFWACLLGVVVLSLTPVQQLPPQVLNLWDKAQHAGGFAVLTLLGLWAYPQRAVTLLAAMLALGAGIEVAQAATGWRYGDVLDWVADAVGVAAAYTVWRLLQVVCGRSQCQR